MTTTTPDPISNNVDRVLVRNTASGFEQGIAATAGLFTAGPIGALASWGAIRGLQGKWTPWFIIGVPAAVAINIVNVVALGVIVGGSDPAPSYNPNDNQSSIQQELPSYVSNLPSYNLSNTSSSTLVEKCQALAKVQNTDLIESARIAFQIGYHHDTPWDTSVDQDCASVGVDTSYL